MENEPGKMKGRVFSQGFVLFEFESAYIYNKVNPDPDLSSFRCISSR